MKRIILSIALACISTIASFAQLNGNGYYRIQNAKTGRYMSLCDNHSDGIDLNSTSVDASALVTKKNLDEVLSDPGTIFYIEKISNDNYNISAQGSNVYDMIHYYIRLAKLEDGTYRAWQIDKGQPIFLSEADNAYYDKRGVSYVNTTTTTTQRWYIKPVNTEDNYICVKPCIKANGKNYATFFADFPFSFASKGMSALYLNKVNADGNAVYKEIDGIVPAKTPVIIECTDTEAANNKLKIEATSPSSIKDNLLVGVYFSIGDQGTDHFKSVEFDATSMRVLGISDDGSLEFNNKDTYMLDTQKKIPVGKYDAKYQPIKAIPHNTCYLKVSNDCPSSLKLVDAATAGIKDITLDPDNKPANVYNLEGKVVKTNATSVEGLPKGVYIFKNKKYLVE